MEEEAELRSDAEVDAEDMLSAGLEARGDVAEPLSESARSTAGNSSPEGVGEGLE